MQVDQTGLHHLSGAVLIDLRDYRSAARVGKARAGWRVLRLTFAAWARDAVDGCVSVSLRSR